MRIANDEELAGFGEAKGPPVVMGIGSLAACQFARWHCGAFAIVARECT
jgi:hypothetical protein